RRGSRATRQRRARVDKPGRTRAKTLHARDRRRVRRARGRGQAADQRRGRPWRRRRARSRGRFGSCEESRACLAEAPREFKFWGGWGVYRGCGGSSRQTFASPIGDNQLPHLSQPASIAATTTSQATRPKPVAFARVVFAITCIKPSQVSVPLTPAIS